MAHRLAGRGLKIAYEKLPTFVYNTITKWYKCYVKPVFGQFYSLCLFIKSTSHLKIFNFTYCRKVHFDLKLFLWIVIFMLVQVY